MRTAAPQQKGQQTGKENAGLDGILEALKGAKSHEQKLMALGQLCSFAESSSSAARLIAEKFSQVSQYFRGYKENGPYALPALLKISMDSGRSAPLDLFFELAQGQPRSYGTSGVASSLRIFLSNNDSAAKFLALQYSRFRPFILFDLSSQGKGAHILAICASRTQNEEIIADLKKYVLFNKEAMLANYNNVFARLFNDDKLRKPLYIALAELYISMDKSGRHEKVIENDYFLQSQDKQSDYVLARQHIRKYLGQCFSYYPELLSSALNSKEPELGVLAAEYMNKWQKRTLPQLEKAEKNSKDFAQMAKGIFDSALTNDSYYYSIAQTLHERYVYRGAKENWEKLLRLSANEKGMLFSSMIALDSMREFDWGHISSVLIALDGLYERGHKADMEIASKIIGIWMAEGMPDSFSEFLERTSLFDKAKAAVETFWYVFSSDGIMKKLLKNPDMYSAGATLKFPAKALLDSMADDEKFANFFLQCISGAVRYNAPGTSAGPENAVWLGANPPAVSTGHEHQIWLEFDESLDFAIKHSEPSQIERMKKLLEASAGKPETSLGAKHLLHMIDWSLGK